MHNILIYENCWGPVPSGPFPNTFRPRLRSLPLHSCGTTPFIAAELHIGAPDGRATPISPFVKRGRDAHLGLSLYCSLPAPSTAVFSTVVHKLYSPLPVRACTVVPASLSHLLRVLRSFRTKSSLNCLHRNPRTTTAGPRRFIQQPPGRSGRPPTCSTSTFLRLVIAVSTASLRSG